MVTHLAFAGPKGSQLRRLPLHSLGLTGGDGLGHGSIVPGDELFEVPHIRLKLFQDLPSRGGAGGFQVLGEHLPEFLDVLRVLQGLHRHQILVHPAVEVVVPVQT